MIRPHDLAKRHVVERRLAPLAAAALALAGCAGRYPQTTLSPQSDVGWMIQNLLTNIVAWCIGIFLVVAIVLTVAIIRYRRPGADDAVPEAMHGHSGLEIGWTIAPAVILIFIAVPTISTIFKIGTPNPGARLQVEVTGHQWWWEFRYPQLGIVTANELHLPQGQTVNFDLRTGDVIHSFWIPALGGKRDVEPNRVNHMWFTPQTVGVFPGQCVEFCGLNHANMRLKAFVQTPTEFEAWVRQQQSAGPPVPGTTASGAAGAAAPGTAQAAPAPSAAQAAPAPSAAPAAGGLVAKGAGIFASKPCIACHTMQGVSAGLIGPNLTHVGSRTTIGAGIMPNTPQNLAAWLRNTDAVKPGTIMAQTMHSVKLTEDEVQALVAYLESRK